MKLNKGVYVSIQGLSHNTTSELITEALSAGAAGIKTDKEITLKGRKDITIIGCHKVRVRDKSREAYITPTVEEVKKVAEWADLVSIDYRRINKNLKAISEYCRDKKIPVVADIGTMEDLENIQKCGLYYTYIATTFSVFGLKYYPDLEFLKALLEHEKNILAEGNYQTRGQVIEAMKAGADHFCIGAAICNVYKLTRKFTTIRKDKI